MINHSKLTFFMVLSMFIFFIFDKIQIYPVDLFGYRLELFDMNYALQDSNNGFNVYGNAPGNTKILKEYTNRDSLLQIKTNSMTIHNYLLTKFKYNLTNGKPNVLHCAAHITGYRNLWPTTAPNIVDITCD